MDSRTAEHLYARYHLSELDEIELDERDILYVCDLKPRARGTIPPIEDEEVLVRRPTLPPPIPRRR